MQIILRQCGNTGCQVTKSSLQQLLSDGFISANARTPEGKTLLHYAAENNEEGLVRDLLSHKEFDPNQKYRSYDFGYNEGYQTPIGIAKAWGHSVIVELLRGPGAIGAILN
jgi:ankyrin repeat protein